MGMVPLLVVLAPGCSTQQSWTLSWLAHVPKTARRGPLAVPDLNQNIGTMLQGGVLDALNDGKQSHGPSKGDSTTSMEWRAPMDRWKDLLQREV